MFSQFKKIILVFLSLSLVISSSLLAPASALAQESTWYNQGFTDWYVKVYDAKTSSPSEIFGERYTAAQVQWIIYSLVAFPINFLGSRIQEITACILAAGSAGINIIADVKCADAIVSFASEIIDVLQISGIAQNTDGGQNVAALLLSNQQSRPISGIKYLQNKFSRILQVPEVQAQGYGFGAVDGLQKYWQGFRDIAYTLSVLAIIIFAFMIMFRVKINPQTVISIQSAIPKVIIAVVLATFSYAIAGLVIDLSYVVGGLLASLINLAGFAVSVKDAWNFIVPIGGTSALGGFYILFYMFGYTFLFFIAAVVTLVGTVSGLSVFGVVSSLIMIILSIWVLILMLWYTIKVPWVLIKNLVSLFISIVVAPVQIMIGVLVPTIGFGMWFKKIISEALVFPLTGLFMFLAWKTLYASMAASLGQFTQIFGAPNQNLWTPPILGSSADMAGVLWLAVSFMFIVMIPKAVDIMKMLIMGEKFTFGTAIGEAMAPAKFGWNMIGGDVISRSMQYGGAARTARWLETLSHQTWLPQRARAGLTRMSSALTEASKAERRVSFPDSSLGQ